MIFHDYHYKLVTREWYGKHGNGVPSSGGNGSHNVPSHQAIEKVGWDDFLVKIPMSRIVCIENVR